MKVKTHPEEELAPLTVTSLAKTLAAQSRSCVTWKVKHRAYVSPEARELSWTTNLATNILAGDVAEAVVRQYLCNIGGANWRTLIEQQHVGVPVEHKRAMISYFAERLAAVRDAVLQIKTLSGVVKWVAPTENFRLKTHDHGIITGRVDFYGQRDRTMYIVETKFSSNDMSNMHCWQMELYSRWGVLQPGVEECYMIYYNVRSGVLEMGAYTASK
ncbi:hypothetical protein HDU93_004978 [Gonapodya sp. JEL0774]|nr:hypothetical protein HDU93_004978 [Gonapodya sp. JEL0774]